MAFVLVRHKVKDYKTWKPFFAKDAAARKAAGSKNGQVFRSKDNPNEVIILFSWDSIDNAKKFASSPKLMEIMMKAGVMDKPDIYFLEEADKVQF